MSVLTSVASERVRFLRNPENLGVSAARNRGVNEARGEFVVFLDDDDELRPEALATLRRYCVAEPRADFLWGGRCIHEKDALGRVVSMRQDDWTQFLGPIRGSQLLALTLELAASAAFTIRRTLFQSLGGFDEQLKVSEDRNLFIQLARNESVGRAVAEIIIDVDEHLRGSLSRNSGHDLAPYMDLCVIERHRQYLDRAEHADFMNAYLLAVYSGFLQCGKRREAGRIAFELYRRGAWDVQILRRYLRHAPEFRALKTLLHYEALRRWRLRVSR